MIGPGKYDTECTEVRQKVGADACILIVIHGNRGTGFSCQASIEVTMALPSILRTVADQIEIDGP